MIRPVPTRLAGLVRISPRVFQDERGFFLETYRDDEFAAVGVPNEFEQDNHSRSVRGTLRGLHFQIGNGQAKLVRVARGAILDVVVDLRRSSPTYGSHEAFDLDDVGHNQLYVPIGFAHGFLVLSEFADVCYKVSTRYDPALERGIAWNDPGLGINWPVAEPVLSRRDRILPTLEQLGTELPEW